MENEFQVISRNTDGEERTVHFEGTVEQVVSWLTDPVIQESADDNLVYEVYNTKTFSYFSITEFLALFGNLLDKIKIVNSEPIIKVSPDKPQDMVGKYFTMNPETDDLLLTSYALRPGMEVLVESSNLRGDVNKYEDEMVMDRLLQYNRWCVIEDVRITKDDCVNFIGKYEDDTKRSFTLGASHSWFVKKESINKNEQIIEEKMTMIKDAVLEATRFAVYLATGDPKNNVSDERKQEMLYGEINNRAKEILNRLS